MAFKHDNIYNLKCRDKIIYICDDCGKEITTRWDRMKNKLNNKHYCKYCVSKGERNPMKRQEIKVKSGLKRCGLKRSIEVRTRMHYTGDWKIALGGKCPDFVNEKNKKIIELFGDYWHNQKFFPKTQTPEERINHFKKYGYDTLIIWGSEMKQNIEQVKQKIIEFNRGI